VMAPRERDLAQPDRVRVPIGVGPVKPSMPVDLDLATRTEHTTSCSNGRHGHLKPVRNMPVRANQTSVHDAAIVPRWTYCGWGRPFLRPHQAVGSTTLKIVSPFFSDQTMLIFLQTTVDGQA
jgi:hypothetical protein